MTGFPPNSPTRYVGPNVFLVPSVTRNREPTGADYRQPETGKLYPVSTIWQVGKDPTTGTEGEMFILTKIVANVGYWQLITDGTVGPLLKVQVDDNIAPGVNPVEPDADGLMRVHGTIVDASLIPIQTISRALNAYSVEVQVSTETAASDRDLNGLSHFNNAQFDVDADGFVSLNGGTGPALQTLSDDVNTIITPTGSPQNIQLVGHVVEQGATKFSTVVAGTHLANINPMSSARWIVDQLGFNGTHTTISAANAAATSGDTIVILPGVYPENIAAKPGVNYVAQPGDEFLPNVTVTGKWTFSSAGTINLSNIRLQTNADFLLSVTGTAASIVNFENCYFNCTNNTGISFTTANTSSVINLISCNTNVTTTGIALFSFSGTGTFVINKCVINNSGSTLTNSTCSAGSLGIYSSIVSIPITVSSTGVITSYWSSLQVATTTPITMTNSPTHNAFVSCLIGGSTNPAINIGTGSVAYVANTDVNSTNTNAITGGGTILGPSITYSGTSSANNVTTIQPTAFGLTKTFTPVLSFGGASVGITYGAQAGKYWLIGPIVFFDITIILTSKGSSTGTAAVSLPFTSANDGHQLSVNIQSNITFPASCTALVGEIVANTSAVSIQGYGSTAIVSATNTQFANTSILLITGFYWGV